MRLTGWTWLIAGAIIAIMSGYVYLTIPKNGQPNMAMAIFFFIGIIFIVVGIAKLFFKRMDDQSVMDSIKTAQETPKIVTIPNNTSNANNANAVDSRPNKIDETIAQMMQQEQTEKRSQAPISSGSTSPTQTEHKHHTGHTNSFASMYEYKGPVHNPSQGVHAQHPVSQHTQSGSTQHRVQNTTEHSVKCKRCGNANTGSSNYCHQCGNRLK